ncbi:hypothetical protein DJ018_04880 [Phenylobacterium deserti]|uniref:Uncharacterized protein n=1 Tax=Phenylobacterium deserti TaxID=1914756 RepID=A0A328ASI8_9CAUL|nr:hypothetical protein DJ018_04880 [Phenylobacterium deserti]
MATVISVYEEQPNGGPQRHDFNLSDFGGQLPANGDLIIKPHSLSADGPEVWEVVARYHQPGRGFDAEGALRVVVRSRLATEAEKALLA